MGKIDTIVHEGETIHLKKGSLLGWRVVEPLVLKDPNTGKIDWKTWSWSGFFNKKGFFTLGFLLLLLFIGWLAFGEQVANYESVLNNPCAYCTTCQQYASSFANSLYNSDINKSLINLNLTLNG